MAFLQMTLCSGCASRVNAIEHSGTAFLAACRANARRFIAAGLQWTPY